MIPKKGADCQFVITTHSEFLSSAIPGEREICLEKGGNIPVATLFIEGKLDAEQLNSIFQDNPGLKIGGSKSNLKKRAWDEGENKITAGYLHDRNFD